MTEVPSPTVIDSPTPSRPTSPHSPAFHRMRTLATMMTSMMKEALDMCQSEFVTQEDIARSCYYTVFDSLEDGDHSTETFDNILVIARMVATQVEPIRAFYDCTVENFEAEIAELSTTFPVPATTAAPFAFTPPAPRLVCVETNPGPPKSRRHTKITKRGILRTKRRTHVKPHMSSAGTEFQNGYLATLNNPFEYGGMKLGYDCYVASDLSTAYVRGSFIVNADGTFSIVFCPNVTYLVSYNNQGAATTTYTTLSATNSGTIVSNYGSARVVSGGVRCFPNTGPGATNIGVMYAGSIPNISKGGMVSLSPSVLTTLPQSEMGVGVHGACFLTRPVDNDSFVFSINPLSVTTSLVGTTSSGFITGAGFPAGTVIYFESILNLECLAGGLSGSVAVSSNRPNPEPTASDYFPSPESLLAKLRPYIADAAVMDFAEAAVKTAVGVKSAANNIRSMFARSRNTRVGGNITPYKTHDELAPAPKTKDYRWDPNVSNGGAYVKVAEGRALFWDASRTAWVTDDGFVFSRDDNPGPRPSSSSSSSSYNPPNPNPYDPGMDEPVIVP